MNGEKNRVEFLKTANRIGTKFDLSKKIWQIIFTKLKYLFFGESLAKFFINILPFLTLIY